MLRISVARNEGEIGILIRGHADYAPRGLDIVCAGVSAIIQAAVCGLREIAKEYPGYVSFEEHDDRL